MKKKPLALVAFFAASLAIFLLFPTLRPQQVQAQEEYSDIEVYITASGGKYHREDCRYAKKALTSLPLSQARSRGLSACAICFSAEEREILNAPRRIKARVIAVSDGDTITVLEGKTQYRLRLNGIDAPESRQAWGRRSKEYLSRLVFDKTLTVELIEMDRYGRHVANIFLEDVWVNRLMVEAGLAWHYRAYSDSAVLQGAEDRARREKIGLWADAHPIPPWDWRRK